MLNSSIIESLEIDYYSDQDILDMLSIECGSIEYFELLYKSYQISRKQFGDQGYLFVQIGLNGEPCSGNCRFCSMGVDHYSLESQWRRSRESIESEVAQLCDREINDIFLMATADYPLIEYMDIVKGVKPLLHLDQKLVANIGDFDLNTALKLKGIGVSGFYHVHRLGEGVDTDIASECRLKSLEAIKDAQMDLYYCIEPIGIEHTYEQILVEIRRAEKLKPTVMAVMKRVGVDGTPLSKRGEISAMELIKIAAVTNLVVKPTRAMNLHETEPMSMLAGINQIYVEYGANPRDRVTDTQQNRGLKIEEALTILKSANYRVYKN